MEGGNKGGVETDTNRQPLSPPPFLFPQVQTHPSVLPLFLAWAAADVVRYAWYAAGGAAPHWLTWLRYSAFVPLYPLGIFAGEMPIIRAAIPYIAKRGLWSVAMPNAWNGAFSYAAFCRVGLYVLLPAAFLHLYSTLLAARRKKLKPARD
jgi:very-long-chain (3R)-3-hydroxyacyl-CoA dehydratase